MARSASTLYQHNLTGILETAVRATNAQFDNPEILKRLDVRLLEVINNIDLHDGFVYMPGDERLLILAGFSIPLLSHHHHGPPLIFFPSNHNLAYGYLMTTRVTSNIDSVIFLSLPRVMLPFNPPYLFVSTHVEKSLLIHLHCHFPCFS